MHRALTLLFRRDPSRDRAEEKVHYEGYEILWPDERPVAVGVDAFCKHGQRLLGLGRHLEGRSSRVLEMLCFPKPIREAAMTKLQGHRVRRFYLERQGRTGRLHFLDGTPTAVVIDMDRDEEEILAWLGLPDLNDGERQWFDLAARPLGEVSECTMDIAPVYESHVLAQNASV